MTAFESKLIAASDEKWKYLENGLGTVTDSIVRLINLIQAQDSNSVESTKAAAAAAVIDGTLAAFSTPTQGGTDASQKIESLTPKNAPTHDPGTPEPPGHVSVKVTVHAPKPFMGNVNECEHFIEKMKHHVAAPYLEGQPDKFWATETELLRIARHPHSLTWHDFESLLENNFGKITPMAEYFKEYENL